ncbi:MAG: SRPBCC family protein [Chitinophagaceae bacterium]
MSVHRIKAVQKIPADIHTVWRFFSRPENLATITPASLNFRVTSVHHGEVIYPGQIIEYKISPIAGIPLYWMTEITQVIPHQLFVDEQRYGPYSLWHHQHHFLPIDGGVEMTDIVHYKVPLGFLGDLVNSLWVRHQLHHIFRFRYQKAEELLGKWEGDTQRLEFS